MDNFAAGYAACAHLLALGHRRIAILTRPPTLSTVVKRTQSYRQALVDAGVAPEAQHTSGVRCPQQLSRVALDDPPWATLTEPSLTVIRHPLEGLTARCVASLLTLRAVANLKYQTVFFFDRFAEEK